MKKISLNTIEQAITKARPEDQRRLLARLPRLLNLPGEDLELLQLAAPSFSFWLNPEDDVYDRL